MRHIRELTKNLSIGILGIITLLGFVATMIIAAHYLFVNGAYFDFFGDRDPSGAFRSTALLHIVPAMTALMIGALQMLSALRGQFARFHKAAGWCYVLSVMLSGIGAILLAPNSLGGVMNGIGFTLLALCWIITTLVAVYHATNRQKTAHRAWMIRSFALTFAGVTLRLQLGIFQACGLTFSEAYSITAWSSWIPNLLIADIWLRRGAVRHGSALKIEKCAGT